MRPREAVRQQSNGSYQTSIAPAAFCASKKPMAGVQAGGSCPAIRWPAVQRFPTLLIEKPSSGITCSMPDEYNLALRQADQARTDFAAIESDLQFVINQLARIPTRKELARTALGIIFGTAGLVIGGSSCFGGTACDF